MVRRFLPLFTLLLGLFATTVPAFAATSTFYVFAKEVTQNGVVVSTEVSVTNPTDTTLSLTVLALPVGIDIDGTNRAEGGEETVEIPPQQTWVLTGLVKPGMNHALLEISAPEELVFQAELVPRVDGQRGSGAQIPVISSRTAIPRGGRGFIQNIEGTTNLGVVNLGDEAADCAYELRFASGQLEGRYQFNHAPRSTTYFTDVLALTGDKGRTDLRIGVTCNQDFHVFADAVNGDRGEVSTMRVSQTGLSTLTPPGQEPPCPQKAYCYNHPSSFIPVRGAEVLKLYLPVPPGTYERVTLSMDVTHGGWSSGAAGFYNLFYMAIDKSWRKTIGYAQFKEPNQVILQHGIDSGGDKTTFKRSVADLQPGDTYHVEFVYDTNARQTELVITAGSGEIVRFNGSPRVSSFDVRDGGFVFLELSIDADSHFHLDRPSFGWKYDNLNASFQRR